MELTDWYDSYDVMMDVAIQLHIPIEIAEELIDEFDCDMCKANPGIAKSYRFNTSYNWHCFESVQSVAIKFREWLKDQGVITIE